MASCDQSAAQGVQRNTSALNSRGEDFLLHFLVESTRQFYCTTLCAVQDVEIEIFPSDCSVAGCFDAITVDAQPTTWNLTTSVMSEGDSDSAEFYPSLEDAQEEYQCEEQGSFSTCYTNVTFERGTPPEGSEADVIENTLKYEMKRLDAAKANPYLMELCGDSETGQHFSGHSRPIRTGATPSRISCQTIGSPKAPILEDICNIGPQSDIECDTAQLGTPNGHLRGSGDFLTTDCMSPPVRNLFGINRNAVNSSVTANGEEIEEMHLVLEEERPLLPTEEPLASPLENSVCMESDWKCLDVPEPDWVDESPVPSPRVRNSRSQTSFHCTREPWTKPGIAKAKLGPPKIDSDAMLADEVGGVEHGVEMESKIGHNDMDECVDGDYGNDHENGNGPVDAPVPLPLIRLSIDGCHMGTGNFKEGEENAYNTTTPVAQRPSRIPRLNTDIGSTPKRSEGTGESPQQSNGSCPEAGDVSPCVQRTVDQQREMGEQVGLSPVAESNVQQVTQDEDGGGVRASGSSSSSDTFRFQGDIESCIATKGNVFESFGACQDDEPETPRMDRTSHWESRSETTLNGGNDALDAGSGQAGQETEFEEPRIVPCSLKALVVEMEDSTEGNGTVEIGNNEPEKTRESVGNQDAGPNAETEECGSHGEGSRTDQLDQQNGGEMNGLVNGVHKDSNSANICHAENTRAPVCKPAASEVRGFIKGFGKGIIVDELFDSDSDSDEDEDDDEVEDAAFSPDDIIGKEEWEKRCGTEFGHWRSPEDNFQPDHLHKNNGDVFYRMPGALLCGTCDNEENLAGVYESRYTVLDEQLSEAEWENGLDRLSNECGEVEAEEEMELDDSKPRENEGDLKSVEGTEKVCEIDFDSAAKEEGASSNAEGLEMDGTVVDEELGDVSRNEVKALETEKEATGLKNNTELNWNKEAVLQSTWVTTTTEPCTDVLLSEAREGEGGDVSDDSSIELEMRKDSNERSVAAGGTKCRQALKRVPVIKVLLGITLCCLVASPILVWQFPGIQKTIFPPQSALKKPSLAFMHPMCMPNSHPSCPYTLFTSFPSSTGFQDQVLCPTQAERLLGVPTCPAPQISVQKVGHASSAKYLESIRGKGWAYSPLNFITGGLGGGGASVGKSSAWVAVAICHDIVSLAATVWFVRWVYNGGLNEFYRRMRA